MFFKKVHFKYKLANPNLRTGPPTAISTKKMWNGYQIKSVDCHYKLVDPKLKPLTATHTKNMRNGYQISGSKILQFAFFHCYKIFISCWVYKNNLHEYFSTIHIWHILFSFNWKCTKLNYHEHLLHENFVLKMQITVVSIQRTLVRQMSKVTHATQKSNGWDHFTFKNQVWFHDHLAMS